MDILPNEYSEKEISQEIADSYSRMCHELSMPDTSRIFRQAGNRISFQSAQPYPAGIQFRKIGTGSWSTIWDNENSCSHEVVLPESDGEKFEIRFVCNIYRSGWAIINSDTVIVTI